MFFMPSFFKIYHMRSLIIVLITLAGLTGCDIQKKALKNKEDRTVKEQVETITTRKGDTVSYVVPKITYKDTTIVKTNYVTGTTQVLRYNSEGQIDLAQCISGAIEEITRSNRELVEAIKNKDQEKTEDFDSSVSLYFMAGLAAIILIIGFFAFKLISQNSQAVKSVLEKL